MTKEKKQTEKKKPSQKLSQKERFIEYAKEIGVEENEKELDRVFEKVLKKKTK